MSIGELVERFLPGEDNPRRLLLATKDAIPMIKYLLKQTQLIKEYPFSTSGFVLFKYQLLSDNVKHLFIWSVPSIGKPYVKFDLDWGHVNTPLDCYVVWCILNEVEIYFPKPKEDFPL
jgi:hypothetical protein